MFFWRRVAPHNFEEGLKPTATPGYTRNFRELNDLVAQGKSFSGYERNPFYWNLQGEGFAEVAGLLGIDFDDDARAIACMDWDRDGDLDLWVTNRTAPRVRLLRNNQPSHNTSLSVRLIGNGTTTNRDAIGARLTLSDSSEQLHQLRTVRAGDGFLAQSSDWTHFGLGQTTGELTLQVQWPGAATETYSGLQPGERVTITQGTGQAQSLPSDLLTEVPTLDPPITSATEVVNSGIWVANRVPLPALSYRDERGENRVTTSLLGKPVFLSFWATWCVPCVEELGVLAEHADALREKGVSILALNIDALAADGGADPPPDLDAVLSRIGFDLPHGVGQRENLAKMEILIEYLSARRMPLTIPASFLIDANGQVAAVYREPIRWEQLMDDLALLNASPSETLRRMAPRTGRWFVDPRQAMNRDAYLGDYATLFAKNGFPKESQRLYQMIAEHRATRTPQERRLDARAHYNLAKSAAQQGRKQQAKEHYRTAIRLDPQFGPALTGLGAELLLENRIEEAEPFFEQALRIDPNYATALVNLAMIDQARGDRQSALRRLRQVIRRNPEFAQAQLNLGSLLASMQQYEEAIAHLSKAVTLKPNLVPAHMNLAITYGKTKRWRQAEEHYQSVLRLSPQRAALAHLGLGSAQAQQGRHDVAVASYRQAIAAGAKNARTYTQLAISHAALQDLQGAAEALDNALELDPQYLPAQTLQRQIAGRTKRNEAE